MTQRTSIHGLHVATDLYQFIEDQVLPAVGVKSKTFWSGFDAIVKDGDELWQIEPMTWLERFRLTWRIFAYPSRHMVMVICKRGVLQRLVEEQ